MKNKFLTLWISLSLLLGLAPLLKAEPSITEIKDLYTIFDKNYNHLSPLHGYIAWKSNWIEQVYRSDDKQNSSARELIHLLFYLQHDQVTFDCTSSPASLATYFDEYTIGSIIGFIEKNREALLQATRNMRKKLKIVFQKDIANLIVASLPKDIDNTIKATIENKIQEYQKKHKDLILDECDFSLDQDFNLVVTQKKPDEEKTSFSEQAKKLETVLTKTIKTFQTNKAIQFAERITNFIIQNHANDRYFDQDAIYRIFNAWLWRKANPVPVQNSKELSIKQYFINYVNALQKQLGDKQMVLKNKDTTDFIKQKPFDKNDYIDIKKNKLSLDFDAENTLEQVYFLYFGKMLYEDTCPPAVKGTSQALVKNTVFSDCGETSLRNFFNLILFDATSHMFDIKLLDQLEGLTVHKKLKDFYKNHKTLEDIESSDSYNEWAAVCAGLAGVTYAKNSKCEIDAADGLFNMGRVIAALIGYTPKSSDPAMATKETFNALIKALEKHTITLTHDFSEKTSEIKRHHAYNFSVNKGVATEYVTWTFRDGHFFITFKKPEVTQTDDAFYQALVNNVLSGKRARDEAAFMPLITLNVPQEKVYDTHIESLIAEDDETLVLLKLVTKPENSFLASFFIYSDNDNLKERLINEIVKRANTLQPTQTDVLDDIYDSILESTLEKDTDDKHSNNFYTFMVTEINTRMLCAINDQDKKVQMLCSIITSKTEALYPGVKLVLKAITDDGHKETITEALCKSGTEQFYDWIKDTFKTTTTESLKIKIAKAIIANNIHDLDNLVEETNVHYATFMKKNTPDYQYIYFQLFESHDMVEVITNAHNKNFYGLIKDHFTLKNNTTLDLSGQNGVKIGESLLSPIIKNKVIELYDLVEKYLPIKTDNGDWIKLIETIVKVKNYYFYDWVKKTAKTVTDPEYVAKIIHIIADHQAVELYSLAKELFEQTPEIIELSFLRFFKEAKNKLLFFMGNLRESIYRGIPGDIRIDKFLATNVKIVEAIVHNNITELAGIAEKILCVLPDKTKDEIICNIIRVHKYKIFRNLTDNAIKTIENDDLREKISLFNRS